MRFREAAFLLLFGAYVATIVSFAGLVALDVLRTVAG